MSTNRAAPTSPPWTLGKTFRRSRDGALEVPSWDARVSRGFVATFVAERLDTAIENLRNEKNKIGKQFDAAVSNGLMSKNDIGLVKFSEVVRWIHSKSRLARVVEGLHPPTSGSAELIMPPMTMNASGTQLPTSIQESNLALARSLTDLNLLQTQNALLLGEVNDYVRLSKRSSRSQPMAVDLVGEVDQEVHELGEISRKGLLFRNLL